MASQFVVKQNGLGGFDVLQRQLVAQDELNARFHHMTAHAGWSPAQAAAEIEKMHQLQKRNASDDNTRRLSEQFVFEYAEPGDVVVLPEAVFVVNRPAFA